MNTQIKIGWSKVSGATEYNIYNGKNLIGKTDELSYEFESGSTRINVTGGYSNKSKTMIYFIVNRFQIAKMKQIVLEVDPKAYITISEVADVFKNESNI